MVQRGWEGRNREDNNRFPFITFNTLPAVFSTVAICEARLADMDGDGAFSDPDVWITEQSASCSHACLVSIM